MTHRFNLSLALALLMTISLSSSALAQSKEKPESKSPLEITSEKMRTEDNGRKIIFTVNVHATWDDMILDSDILEIYTRPGEKSKTTESSEKKGELGEGQELEKIIAIDNVDITKGTKKAKGDRAVYLDKEQTMTLTGSPHATAWDEDNEMHGKKMVFYLQEDRLEVKSDVRVLLFPKRNGLSKKDKTK